MIKLFVKKLLLKEFGLFSCLIVWLGWGVKFCSSCGKPIKKEITDTYDNIWLSNVAMYLNPDTFKYMCDKMINHLNKDGMILLAYLL